MLQFKKVEKSTTFDNVYSMFINILHLADSITIKTAKLQQK